MPHVKNNVQIVELWINRLKLDYDTRTFGKILRRIRNPPEPDMSPYTPKTRAQKVFLWNKINNTKQRQLKMTGSDNLNFTIEDIIKLWAF